MNLYEIADEYQSVLSESVNAETGEVNEIALQKLDEMVVHIEEKGIAVASYIKNLDAERKAIEEAKIAMAERESALDKRVKGLTEYLRSNMERCGINEIKSPYFAIKLKKCPLSVDIEDEDLITKDYKKVKEVITVDKLKIKDELLSGAVIPGAKLKQNNRLEIR